MAAGGLFGHHSFARAERSQSIGQAQRNLHAPLPSWQRTPKEKTRRHRKRLRVRQRMVRARDEKRAPVVREVTTRGRRRARRLLTMRRIWKESDPRHDADGVVDAVRERDL